MSWWISLIDPTQPPTCDYGQPPRPWYRGHADEERCPEPCYPVVRVARHREGGTYAADGTTEASLNVTYNYGRLLRETLDDPEPDRSDILARLFAGRRAGDMIPLLEGAVAQLGTTRDEDYWAETPGNVGHVLALLLAWARLHPNAVWRVA